jgi:hypothetical protein
LLRLIHAWQQHDAIGIGPLVDQNDLHGLILKDMEPAVPVD